MDNVCTHTDFDADVQIHRTEKDAAEWVAGIRITCKQCGTPFLFRGTVPGARMDPRITWLKITPPPTPNTGTTPPPPTVRGGA